MLVSPSQDLSTFFYEIFRQHNTQDGDTEDVPQKKASNIKYNLVTCIRLRHTWKKHTTTIFKLKKIKIKLTKKIKFRQTKPTPTDTPEFSTVQATRAPSVVTPKSILFRISGSRLLSSRISFPKNSRSHFLNLTAGGSVLCCTTSLQAYRGTAYGSSL